MPLGTVTSKGRTTIPKQVRDKLNLKPGDKLFWLIEDGRVVLRAKNRSIKEAAGMLYRPGQRPATLEELDEAIAKAAAESAMGGLKPKR